MRHRPLCTLALSLLVVGGCTATNPWWEASQSGWAMYGQDVPVPRQAKPVPISLLAEASTWDVPVYVEGWIDEVDPEEGAWMRIGDGTTNPLLVITDGRFNLPRNARGRRAMVWGRPLVAIGSIDENTSMSVEFVAQSVMVQGFYGLEAPRPVSAPASTVPLVPLEPAVEAEAAEPDSVPMVPIEPMPSAEAETPEPPAEAPEAEDTPPPPIVDLPDR